MKNRAYKIAINPKYDGYQKESTVVAYKVFDKNIRSGASINEELDPELHKPVIKKCKRKIDFARLKDNIWIGDLSEIGLLSSKNGGVK